MQTYNLHSELFFNDVLDNIALVYVIKQEVMKALQLNELDESDTSDSDTSSDSIGSGS